MLKGNNIISENRCPSHKIKTSGCDKYGKQRLELACILREILNEMKIKWYIENGTLLGAYRNNKFIPHDDDFDIALLYDKDPILQLKNDIIEIKKKLPNKYDVRLVTSYSDKIEVFEPAYGKYILIGERYNKADFHHVTVDLQAYKLEDSYYISLYKGIDIKHHKNDIISFKTLELEKEFFPVPNNTEKILKNTYGSIDKNAIYNPLTKKYELK